MGTYSRGPFNKYDLQSGKGTKPPRKPGAYRIAEKETRGFIYEGESVSIARRMYEQKVAGKLDPTKHVFLHKAADGRSTSSTRRAVESIHIIKHQPQVNKRNGGGGRPAKGGSGRRPSR